MHAGQRPLPEAHAGGRDAAAVTGSTPGKDAVIALVHTQWLGQAETNTDETLGLQPVDRVFNGTLLGGKGDRVVVAGKSSSGLLTQSQISSVPGGGRRKVTSAPPSR